MPVHSKGIVILIDNNDLTRYFNEETATGTTDAVDTTTFGTPGDARTYIPGLRDDSLTAGGFYDNSLDAIDDVLRDYLGTGVAAHVTVCPGGAANLARCQMIEAVQTNYELDSAVEDAVTFSVEWVSGRDSGLDDGVLLKGLSTQTPAANATATYTGTAVINTDALGSPTATANGWVAQLHALKGATGAGSKLTAKIYHGDGSTYAVLYTFTDINIGTGTGGFQRASGTGNVNSHVYAEVATVAGSGAPASWRSALGFARL